jgi:hypothetical protein
MPTLESTIRMLNRRLNEVYNFFGHKSPEYMKLQSILYQNFGDRYVVRGGGKKAARISRSKEALNYFRSDSNLKEDIEWIYDAIKKMGTVKEMAERYVEPSEYNGSFFTKRIAESMKQAIRQRAQAEYSSAYNDTDIYTEVNNANDEGDSQYREALADIMEKFHESPGKNNLPGMEQKYSEIEEMYENAVENHNKWKEATKFTSTILKNDNPYDMGVNK